MPQLEQIELSTADWEGTPAVQQLVLALLAENQELKARLSLIEEQIKQNIKSTIKRWIWSKAQSKKSSRGKSKIAIIVKATDNYSNY